MGMWFDSAWPFGRLVVAIAGGWGGGLFIVLAGLGGFIALGLIGRSGGVVIPRETVMAGIMANTIWFHNSPFVLVSSLF
jgi:hypothetical protein